MASTSIPEPYDGTTTTWYVDSPEVSAPPSEASSSSEAASSSEASSSSAPALTVARPVDTGVKFEEMGLDKKILDGLFAAGFESPSYIQASAIPKILGSPEMHLLVEAQSGSGKTLAFVVPALQRINLAKKTLQVVFILPTRELATQVCKVTQVVGKYLEGLTVQLAVKEDKDTPKIPAPVLAHILVGTPGKVSQVLTTKKYCADPKQIILLAIDEADQMIPPAPTEAHMMFQQLTKARATVHPKCQLLFMSATFPENVEHFRTALFNKGAYDSIRVAPDKRVVSTIQQLFIRCNNNKEKLGALYKIYTELVISQSFIFVRTRETANQLKGLMTKEGFQVSLISSELSPADRDLVFKKFQAGEAKVLIATNVMARGIDVRNVSLIINFDLPTCDKDGKVADVDNYFHRVGRTGRFGDYGLAINLAENDQDMEFIKLFETSQHKEIEPCQVSEIPSLQAKLDIFQNR